MDVVEQIFGCAIRFHYDTKTQAIYAHGADLAKVLGFSNPSDIILRNVSPVYRRKISVGVGQPAWYLSEPGVYQLIFSSSNEKAVKFQSWVLEEVLPTVRREYRYIEPMEPIVNEVQNNRKLDIEKVVKACFSSSVLSAILQALIDRKVPKSRQILSSQELKELD